MHTSWWKVVLGAVMVVNGLLFLAQVRVFDDTAAALRLHRDLPAGADPSLVNLKVGAWALAGLAWVVAGLGLALGRREWLPAAFVGFLLVDGFYAAQLWLWGSSHAAVWTGFGVFGLLALLYGAVCRSTWRSSRGLA